MTTKQVLLDAFSVAKDASLDSIDVTLDTSKWSKRKQNIIVKAIDSGIADCGWQTAHFVSALAKSYGLGTQRLTIWDRGLQTEMIKPDKVTEVFSYIAAMIKMSESHPTWNESAFLESLDTGNTPVYVPLPSNFSKADRHKFIKDYLKNQDEQEQVIRNNLINDIRSGHKLTVSYTIEKGE